ncbi:MAG: response regulator [Candidatus Muiribacteriota bacterium]
MKIDILIVDDCEIQREIIDEYLKQMDMEIGKIYHAGNGNDAYKILETYKVNYVLTDIRMPYMNGIKLVKKLIQNKMIEGTGIIIMSADMNKKIVEKFDKGYIHAYLSKPFSKEELEKELISKK